MIETLEPDGGNLYRPHPLLVNSGQFWRCAHGQTGYKSAMEWVGCGLCAEADPEALLRWVSPPSDTVPDTRTLWGILDPASAARLTAEKTAFVMRRDGSKITGFVVTGPRGNIGIINQSACRWLKPEELWWLMHDSCQLPHPLMDCQVCGQRMEHGHTCASKDEPPPLAGSRFFWQGDMDDDCTCRVGNLLAHVECMGEIQWRDVDERRYSASNSWFVSVGRVDQNGRADGPDLFHSGEHAGMIFGAEMARAIAEAILSANTEASGPGPGR